MHLCIRLFEAQLKLSLTGTVAGPNSDEAKIMDGRSPYKGFGGRDIVDNDESQPLLGLYASHAPYAMLIDAILGRWTSRVELPFPKQSLSGNWRAWRLPHRHGGWFHVSWDIYS